MQLPNQEISSSSTTSSNSQLVETPVLYTPPKTSTQYVPPISPPPSKINNTLSEGNCQGYFRDFFFYCYFYTRFFFIYTFTHFSHSRKFIT